MDDFCSCFFGVVIVFYFYSQEKVSIQLCVKEKTRRKGRIVTRALMVLTGRYFFAPFSKFYVQPLVIFIMKREMKLQIRNPGIICNSAKLKTT